jgi:hypothetical protein
VHFELVGEVSNVCIVQDYLLDYVELAYVVVVRLDLVVANFKSLQNDLLVVKLIFQVS